MHTCFRSLFFAILVMAAGCDATADTRMESELKDAFARGELPGLHSVLVLKSGKVFAEAYFTGEDEKWGVPLGERQHGPDQLHDLRSVTKSIVSLLYGIAMRDRIVPALDTPLVDVFPDYADLANDPERRKILVRHALTMTMGTEWNEDLPYTDPRNSEIAMENAADRFRFVLDRPMVGEPGAEWRYNGGATALIGHLIERGSGKALDEYAREKLFSPLGIEEFYWARGSDGRPSAASGLRLTTHDLAKIGVMINADGKFEGTEIVPAKWLVEATTPHVDAFDLRYGYFWWLADRGHPPVWNAGFGNGGQRFSMNAGLDLVLVIFAGNYNQPDAWQLPVKVITDFLVPALDLK